MEIFILTKSIYSDIEPACTHETHNCEALRVDTRVEIEVNMSGVRLQHKQAEKQPRALSFSTGGRQRARVWATVHPMNVAANRTFQFKSHNKQIRSWQLVKANKQIRRKATAAWQFTNFRLIRFASRHPNHNKMSLWRDSIFLSSTGLFKTQTRRDIPDKTCCN